MQSALRDAVLLSRKVLPPSVIYATAIAAWSVSRDLLKRGIVPSTNSAGAITAIADQVGSRTLTPAGSPVYNTDGVKVDPNAATVPYSGMDGTDDAYSFTTLTLSGDFTIYAAVGIGNIGGVNRTLLGRQGNAAPYIRLVGSSSTLVSFRSDSVGNHDITLSTNRYRRGFHVYRFEKASDVISMYIDGVLVGTNPHTGTWTFDRIGKSNTSNWLAEGFGEMVIFNSVLPTEQANRIQLDMEAAWRSPLYIDSGAGVDSNNGGWNTVNPVASMSFLRDDPHTPGFKALVKSASVYRRDPLFIALATQHGSQARPNIVDVYGGTTPPIFKGSEIFAAGATWTLVTGTEYKIACTGTSPNAWYIKAGVTTRMNAKDGTAGALSVGQSMYAASFLHINVGEDPTAGDVEHSVSTTNADGVAVAGVNWWTIRSMKAMFAFSNGLRMSSAPEGLRFELCVAWYNASDGFNYATSGSIYAWVCIDCDSRYNGSKLQTSGSEGDGYSAHGSSRGKLVRCIAIDNDKSSFNHEGATKITHVACQGSGANLAINLLDQVGSSGELIIEGGSFARKAGSSIKYVVGCLDSDDTPIPSKLTMRGAITLTDPDDANDTIGIYSPSDSRMTGNISAAQITYVNTNTNISWASPGALVQ